MAVVGKGAKEVHLLGQNVNAYHGKAEEDKEHKPPIGGSLKEFIC